MAMMDRVYKYTDRPLTWTRAIVYGTIIWVVAILTMAVGSVIALHPQSVRA